MLAEEMARIGAPNPIGGMGVIMFGPTLLEYGNEEQLARHIPAIVRGELRWCRGFSEQAGSDLAGLQTKAVDMGDHWLVNGSKIWTSGAHLADWCFCLVRTDPSKKHEGISFLLIDMKSPGVEARPILLINGTTPFCETFFTDVKVPKENLMGAAERRPGPIAKRLLQHERQEHLRRGPTDAGGAGRRAVPEPPLNLLARATMWASTRRACWPIQDLRTRLTKRLIEAQAFQLTGMHARRRRRGRTRGRARSRRC